MIVIGVGNRDRGDDAVGPLVVDRLGSSVTCFESNGDPSALISLFGADPDVVIVDAMVSGRATGSVETIEIEVDETLPSAMGFSGRGSTHGFGVYEALELARIIGSLPARVTLVGIEGSSFETGAGPSPELVAAIDQAVELILERAAGVD